MPDGSWHAGCISLAKRSEPKKICSKHRRGDERKTKANTVETKMNTLMGLVFSMMATFGTPFCVSSDLAEMRMDLPVNVDWAQR